ncbi:MAG TPA: prepilin-type N-terminal cleavage/methylation domain-containing protein [Gemmatimonadales bacterium]|nr:prepilin-type N-terminal cleavage/methylation domain-containing protein [Gemmatimonadales bacterium]
MRNRRGLTLIEMLIAIVVFSIVMASTLGFLSKQGKGLDKNTVDMGMLQNLSFAGTLLEQEIRLAGANVPFPQPAVVYAGTKSLVFNADYASNVDSFYTVYYNPGLPAGQVDALRNTQRFALSGTSPAYMYPDSNYYASGGGTTNSPAETITWFFTPDTSTADPADYALMRQVNNAAPETVIRNVLPTPGRNFFRYYYRHIPAAGTSAATLDTVPSSWMPVIHSRAIHGEAGDTGQYARADSLAMVEVAFTVSNGLTGAAQRTRSISYMVPMPNLAVKKVTSCGDAPILGTGVNANWVINTLTSPPDTTMILTWSRAVDEVGGESDVRAYVIWRRPVGTTTWPDPIATVAAGPTSPSYADETAVPGYLPGYEYGLAAQDCTPSLSAMTTTIAPIVP